MKDTLPNTFISLALLFAIVFISLSIAIRISEPNTIPQCAEDVVLVGIGDFEDGRWTSYICGPAVDDYND